ncbi:F0F1 ATP synthase subunit B [Roseofilum casamattae]|uniref:ATP synthase subunit b n=1 Tax=Roseofilum casamattae BLCC-M143 TaxID=3022442 RepID=A0ABT7C2P7_9CYAN|nr:F0F1 ATP synthase subunit B [Roseofilum casamattae]MDJ1185695.1 F0F1 ATP synthase subunit B [Roseofilum casamattae BLCC-M143]
MGNLWLLATEATERGFGLNFDVLETNLINLGIVIGVLVYFGRNLVGDTLKARRAEIETAIADAEERQRKASAALSEQQQNLAQAQAQAEKIRQQASERAETVKADILAQADLDIERMQEGAAQDLEAEQERVMNELRRRVVALAMDRVNGQIGNELNDDLHHQLIERSIARVGGN